MKERALLFGEAKSLAAVITEPDSPPDPGRPAVVFLDAGVLHHVGPNRIHVRLARELAALGFLSMRFDFSGLGDSRPRCDAVPFAESVVAETRKAMDVLAGRGARSFLLFGICSGADAALRVALEDPRVAGAALVEPYLVEGPGYLLYAYRRKLLNPISWWRLLRGQSEILGRIAPRRKATREIRPGPRRPALAPGPWTSGSGPEPGPDAPALEPRPPAAEPRPPALEPPRREPAPAPEPMPPTSAPEPASPAAAPEPALPAAAPEPAPSAPAPAEEEAPLILPSRPEIARQVRALAEKDLDLCFVYAREGPAYHNWLTLLRREVRPALARRRARVLAISRTDHVFTPRAAQDRLVKAVRDWARDAAARKAKG